MYKSGGKNGWALVLLLLAGVVIGGFIGEYLGESAYLTWLAYGKSFGLSTPLVLDLGVIVLKFGLTIKFTISGIIGIVIAAIVYKKM
ncbi:MAG: DUF4321 domain-containing protein [Lachnospiraceae bacterium]|nr:DUF4321 domain-containing protein [Lachnospiraceae bacterium]